VCQEKGGIQEFAEGKMAINFIIAVFPSASKNGLRFWEKRDKQVKNNEETIQTLAGSIAKKLREMRISPSIIHSGRHQYCKSLFKGLLLTLEELDSLKADIASADSLPVRQDMRTAAEQVAQQTYQAAELKVAELVIALVGHCNWKMANVMAETLAYEMTTTEKAKKAAARGDNAAANDFKHRFCLRATFPVGEGPSEILSRIAEQKDLQETAHVEEFGWFKGTFDFDGSGESAMNGVFILVSVKGPEAVGYLSSWLARLGAKEISCFELIDPDEAQ